MESLSLKVRTFASALDVSETNIRNYITKDSKPSSDILERIVQQYPQVNSLWLLTGQGDPFLSNYPPTSEQTTHVQKNFRSPIVGANSGTAYQENSVASNHEMEALQNKLTLAEKEVEHLKAQLATTNALLDSKNEMLTLLRITYNRPN